MSSCGSSTLLKPVRLANTGSILSYIIVFESSMVIHPEYIGKGLNEMNLEERNVLVEVKEITQLATNQIRHSMAITVIPKVYRAISC